jgi:hypothetical protein
MEVLIATLFSHSNSAHIDRKASSVQVAGRTEEKKGKAKCERDDHQENNTNK